MKKKYELKCLGGIHPRIKVSEEFVKKNKFNFTRNQEEIKERIKNGGILDFAGDVLINYLDWENAKEFYKDEFVKKVENKEVEQPQPITDLYETVQDMLDYLVFGWMKSLDERGLSASRTVNKIGHWLWLLGRDDLRRIVQDDALYNPYGMPALVKLSKKIGIKVPKDCEEFAKKKC